MSSQSQIVPARPTVCTLVFLPDPLGNDPKTGDPLMKAVTTEYGRTKVFLPNMAKGVRVEAGLPYRCVIGRRVEWTANYELMLVDGAALDVERAKKRAEKAEKLAAETEAKRRLAAELKQKNCAPGTGGKGDGRSSSESGGKNKQKGQGKRKK